jgi:chorismate mutase
MSGERTLAAVRRDIDAIDDAIHELIIRRTALVEDVRRLKRDWPVKIQPSREAEIIFRLIGRHRGSFPKRELVSIWRSLIVATLSFEGPFSVAVQVPEGQDGYWDLTRDYFGAYAPISVHASALSVVRAVAAQTATVGVLPVPRPSDDEPWWPHLALAEDGAPRIIARLPFAGPGNARSVPDGALVICPVDLTPTGRDRTFLVAACETAVSFDRVTRALTAGGLNSRFAAAWRPADSPGHSLALFETDGFVAEGDARLARTEALLATAGAELRSIGGYARPLTADDLEDGPAVGRLEPPAAAAGEVEP